MPLNQLFKYTQTGISSVSLPNREEEMQAQKEYREKLNRLRRKRRNERKTFVLLALVFLTFFLTYFTIRSISATGHSLYNLSFIVEDRISNSLETQALIVRDETLITADQEGQVIPLAIEGARLAYGSPIALVVKEQIDTLQSDLSSIEEQIIKRQEVLISRGEGVEAAQIYNRYDAQLRQQIKLLVGLQHVGHYKGLSQIEGHIGSILEARFVRLNKLEFNDVVLSELLKQRDSLIRQIGEKSKNFYAPDPGFISYSLDEREELLSMNSIENMALDQIKHFFDEGEHFKSIFNLEFQNSENKDTKKILARLLKGVEQIFVFALPKDKISDLENKTVLEIYSPQTLLDFEARVLKRIEDGDKVYFIVRTNQALTQLMNQRFATLQIKTNTVSGLKVPNKALEFSKENPDLATLTLVYNAHAKKVKVRLLMTNTTDSIIEKISETEEYDFSQGSVVILDAAYVKDGDKVE